MTKSFYLSVQQLASGEYRAVLRSSESRQFSIRYAATAEDAADLAIRELWPNAPINRRNPPMRKTR